MAQIVEYITKEGDRWDSIAQSAYGDATLISGIIDANPAIVISAVLQPGQRITVPVLEVNDVQLDSEALPPWKR